MSSQRPSLSAPTNQPPVTRPSVEDRPPPLSIWLFASLFAIVFINGFDLASNEIDIPASQAFLTHNRTRLNRFAELSRKSPERVRIVMLGNSTLKYGTNIDEESFSFVGDEKFRVIRIINNWARFSDFAPLVEQIFDAQPDLIVMQADLLGRVRLIDHFTKPAQLQRYLKWKAIGQDDWDLFNLDQEELQIDQVDYEDKSDARFERRRLSVTEWQGIDLESQDAKQAKHFLETANAKGISIVLLYSPVTNRAETLEKVIKAELAEEVSRHLESARVTLLEYPHQLEDSHYSDFVHLNASGREIYSKWLVEELSQRVLRHD